LLGKGLELRIYDRNVSTARLVGANREYITQQIPHLSALLCSTLDEVLSQSEVIVVGNAAAEFGDALRRTTREQHVIDLVRPAVALEDIEASYEGVCW
jgi:GDP-mannose 6-dehydrogenase